MSGRWIDAGQDRDLIIRSGRVIVVALVVVLAACSPTPDRGEGSPPIGSTVAPPASSTVVTPPTAATAPFPMWPQSSPDEINDAQERADAGDPSYTWQVEPELVDGAEPFDAEIFERFLRGELGWEAFVPMSGGMYLEEGGLYDGLLFVRCAPGRTNPLSSVYPEMPRGIRGCAPTIDDFRYETARIRLGQPARTDPSGIWVVSA